MHLAVSHYLLVRSRSRQLAGQHVERYLNDNQLISYAEFHILPEEILNGTEADFGPTLEQGLAANTLFARRMLDHLTSEGITSLSQLLDLRQGYATKVLHTLVHLLDGFIGVDSIFYNLTEDSHRVSEELTARMQAAPGEYWLVPVRTGKVTAAVLHPLEQGR